MECAMGGRLDGLIPMVHQFIGEKIAVDLRTKEENGAKGLEKG